MLGDHRNNIEEKSFKNMKVEKKEIEIKNIEHFVSLCK